MYIKYNLCNQYTKEVAAELAEFKAMTFDREYGATVISLKTYLDIYIKSTIEQYNKLLSDICMYIAEGQPIVSMTGLVINFGNPAYTVDEFKSVFDTINKELDDCNPSEYKIMPEIN